MHAVIETGGKQYKVAVGDVIHLERCANNIGEKIDFRSVLLLQNEQGTILSPERLKVTKVVGEILQEGRDKKVLVFKKKRRKNYRRTQGHRQWFTKVRIAEIV